MLVLILSPCAIRLYDWGKLPKSTRWAKRGGTGLKFKTVDNSHYHMKKNNLNMILEIPHTRKSQLWHHSALQRLSEAVFC